MEGTAEDGMRDTQPAFKVCAVFNTAGAEDIGGWDSVIARFGFL